MILVDANILLYAINTEMPQHKAARKWWENILSASVIVGIPWVVALAFLRISTNPRIFSKPLTVKQAIDYLDEWQAMPLTNLVVPGDNHWSIFKNLLMQTGTAGNLSTDAHIAALAIEQGYTVYSADNDFKRFPGLEHINPIANPDNNSVHESPPPVF